MRTIHHALATLLGCVLGSAALAAGAGQIEADTEPASPAVPGTCDDSPVYMLVSGLTLDPQRMGEYARALAESGLYPKLGGYYINAPRPIAVFEGDPPPSYVNLIVRFPCLANARAFWNSMAYQEIVRPIRLDPSAGDYTVTVYRAIDLPPYMQGKVEAGEYLEAFDPKSVEQAAEPAAPARMLER